MPEAQVKWSIANRLSLIVVFFLLVSMFFLTAYQYTSIRDSLHMDMQLRARSILKSLSFAIKQSLKDNNIDFVQRLVNDNAEIIGVNRISFIDSKGNIMADSHLDKVGNQVNTGLFNALLDVKFPYDDFRTVIHDHNMYMLKIINEGDSLDREIMGVIVIGIDLTRTQILLHAYLKKIIIFNGAILVSLNLLLFYFLRVLIAKPVKILQNGIRFIRNGNLSHKVKVKYGGEVGMLAEDFNVMTSDLLHSRQIIEDKNEELNSANQNLTTMNEKLEKTTKELAAANDEINDLNKNLEQKVIDKTKELEKAFMQLVQAEKLSAVGQLASGVAHEFNNVITGILGFTQLAQRSEDMKYIQHCLGVVLDNCKNAQQINESLLNFSRPKAPKLTSVDLHTILDGTLEIAKLKLTKKNIQVNKEFGEILPLKTDPGQLSQVFLNMVINATHAMDDGGKLLITTRKKDDFVEIDFKDNGCGIDKETMIKIFDPFFTTKKGGEIKGTGLGLSVSMRIVKNLGGEIKVDSEKGVGTTFTIVIPQISPDKHPENEERSLT